VSVIAGDVTSAKRNVSKQLNQTELEKELHRHLEQQCQREDSMIKKSGKPRDETNDGMFAQTIGKLVCVYCA
jgi:hypothetical protein